MLFPGSTRLKRMLSHSREQAEEWTRKTRKGLFERMIDPYCWVDAHQPNDLELVLRKVRYLAAGHGLALSENEKRLLSYRNKHLGQRAFIIGNGPSLNRLDLKKLENEVTFGVNAIYLNYENMGFHPTYYLVEDTLVAEDRAQEIRPYRGPAQKFFGRSLDYCLGGAVDTVWLNVIMKFVDYEGFPHFSTNAARCLWAGGTVSYLSLQLAYYMGFRNVYMIGFDHDYVIKQDVDKQGCRFTSTSDDPNHFTGGYFGKGYRWHDPRLDRMESAYRRALEHYLADGRRIFNATDGGKLEIFPRVAYSTLF